MNKRILFNYFLLFSIFVWMMACDRIKKDDLPEPAQAKTLITSAKTPVLQDLTKLHNLSQPATFNLVDTTQWGKAEFVQAGLLMYTPKDDASDVKDTVNYQVCVDGNCKKAILAIQVLAKGTSPKPGDICEQGAFSDIVSLVLPNNQLIIKVLENDTICNAFLEPDSLRITIAPPLGTASVKNGEIIYQINPSQFSGGETETFVYQVAEKGNPNNVKYAAVKVNVLAKPCALIVIDDNYQTEINGGWFFANILVNDNFCEELLATDTLEAIQLITSPIHGQIIKREFYNSNNIMLPQNQGSFVYQPNLDYEGNDQFTYQIKYQDGTAKQGIVNITISGGTSCLNAPPQAKNDTLTYRNVNITPQVNLPIFNNDVICYPALDDTKTKITQDIPSSQGILQGTNYYSIPSPTFTGTVVFKYQICDKYNRCSEATVTLNITN